VNIIRRTTVCSGRPISCGPFAGLLRSSQGLEASVRRRLEDEAKGRNYSAGSGFELMAWRNNMSRKPTDENSKPTTVNESHKPAKHIEETARLASSVEADKDLKKVCKASADG
jgi:hypothetical protein